MWTEKNSSKLFHHLYDKNGKLITGKRDIANTLGEQFENCYSSGNYATEFKKIKSNAEIDKINFKTDKEFKYNKKFKMRGLKWAIKKNL